MVGVPDINSGHHGTPPATQTTHENGLSTGQIGGLIIEMNDILCDEFYPALGSNKTRQFDTIWEAIQSLLCVEVISAAQNLAKITHEPPITIQQPPTAQSYAAVTQSNLPSLSTPRVRLGSQRDFSWIPLSGHAPAQLADVHAFCSPFYFYRLPSMRIQQVQLKIMYCQEVMFLSLAVGAFPM